MKSIVLCGSRRFKVEIRSFGNILAKEGITVFQPFLHSGQEEWDKLSDDYKRFIALGLTHEHFYKIKMADIVYIKDGYVGNSTTLEIGYAMALGKPIYARENDEKICRDVLFRGLIKTPKEMLKIL